MDNIIIRKIWQDVHMMKLKVLCSSSVATIISRIYVDGYMIDELVFKIKRFLDGTIEETTWTNTGRGNDSIACLSLRFFRKDNLGHIVIEVFAELDDGGNYEEHNCCFYICTEHGLLMSFCERLDYLKYNPVGFIVQLKTVN